MHNVRFLFPPSIFVAFILEAFLVEYTIDKSDLQTSLEKKIEELELNVQQYVPFTPDILLFDVVSCCC